MPDGMSPAIKVRNMLINTSATPPAAGRIAFSAEILVSPIRILFIGISSSRLSPMPITPAQSPMMFVSALNIRAMSFYLKDFESKENFLKFIDDYNQEMKDNGDEDKVISYTDVTGVLIKSVKNITNAVSYVLIAFVAISLIVSSIMIGVITYISVLERTKEIGILRAIGASKKDIARIFNAETIIIGLCAGVIGIGLSLLLLIPINRILIGLTKISALRAILPAAGGVALVLISIFLTFIAGLIPSGMAARKDPVVALRTE